MFLLDPVQSSSLNNPKYKTAKERTAVKSFQSNPGEDVVPGDNTLRAGAAPLPGGPPANNPDSMSPNGLAG